MKDKILLIGAIVLFVLPMLLWATDIRGNWIAEMPGTQGIVETVFSFKVDGTKLTGTVANHQGETAISEGKINGDKISFIVVIGGFDGNEMKVAYKGKVALNEIEFTSQVQGGMGQPQKFIAKREFPRHGDLPLRRRPVPVAPSPGR